MTYKFTTEVKKDGEIKEIEKLITINEAEAMYEAALKKWNEWLDEEYPASEWGGGIWYDAEIVEGEIQRGIKR